MSDYFDRQGNPMTMEEWANTFDRENDKVVAHTNVEVDGEEILVSTVWLGLNHQFGTGPPLIFETIIFGLPGDEEPTWRYSTEFEALEGHDRAVNCLRDPIGRFTLGRPEPLR